MVRPNITTVQFETANIKSKIMNTRNLNCNCIHFVQNHITFCFMYEKANKQQHLYIHSLFKSFLFRLHHTKRNKRVPAQCVLLLNEQQILQQVYRVYTQVVHTFHFRSI